MIRILFFCVLLVGCSAGTPPPYYHPQQTPLGCGKAITQIAIHHRNGNWRNVSGDTNRFWYFADIAREVYKAGFTATKVDHIEPYVIILKGIHFKYITGKCANGQWYLLDPIFRLSYCSSLPDFNSLIIKITPPPNN